jgi:hypothetical protein
MLKLDASKLLQKQMDRKDFLKHVGIAAVALTGASTILKVLVDQPTTRQKVQQQASYGGSVYGGVKK